jgi:succinoglycan biosynthesis transport protein ExoP
MYTPSHYKVVDVEARIAQLESAVREERQHMIDRMRTEYETAARFEQSLTGTYKERTRKLEGQTADAFRYNVLKRELDSTEQLYNSLVQKAKEATVASALRVTQVRVIDEARPPSNPYSPNLPLNSAIGFAGGLMFAVGLILVRERGMWRARRPGDSHIYNTRELGVIPAAKNDRALQAGKDRLMATPRKNSILGLSAAAQQEQPSLLMECFRATLTSIRFAPGFERKHGVLTVNSVEPGEGKTTVVSNLGVALAETHGRVLLLDADLRRPRLHKIFAMGNDKGLTSLLTGSEPISGIDLDDVIQATNIPGLSLLSSGPDVASVTPLLYSPRMTELLARVRREFDYILIDTPPAALFSDARIIGKISDYVIMVIHAAKTNREDLEAACLNFKQDGTHILGTILNHGNTTDRRGAYSGYAYNNNA